MAKKKTTLKLVPKETSLIVKSSKAKSPNDKEIAKLFETVERLSFDIGEMEDTDNPELDELIEEKELCLREIIKRDANNIQAHAQLVEFFLGRGVVVGTDLSNLKEAQRLSPSKFAAGIIKEANDLLDEED